MFKTLLSADIKHARSSEDLVARATRHKKTRSSQEPLARAKNSNLQVLQPEARSSDQLLARAKHQKPGQQHLVSKPNQPETNLPNTSYNSKRENKGQQHQLYNDRNYGT